MNTINPDSPIPLYHQIAQLIRLRIESGELSHGDMLETLREAAEEWQVNFHTVRHAYAELARDGLIELLGSQGTRVVGLANKRRAQKRQLEHLESFLAETLRKAYTEYGLSPLKFANLIMSQGQFPEKARPRAYILECSQHQCEDLGRQMESFWNVNAIPLCLETVQELPDVVDGSHLVATHFHYNEIRLRWPQRLAEISFVTIKPSRQLYTTIKQKMIENPACKLTICEHDIPTAEVVAADISTLFSLNEFNFGIRILKGTTDVIKCRKNELLLFSPRVWGSLQDKQKLNKSYIEIRYLYDRDELEQIARKLEWLATPAPGPVAL